MTSSDPDRSEVDEQPIDEVPRSGVGMDGGERRHLVDEQRLHELCVGVLEGVGLPRRGAEIVASCLVAADLRGVESHGSRQLARYARSLRSGAIVADAVPRVVSQRGAVARLDAGHGMGQIAADAATTLAIDLAREHGIGFVNVANSNHFGPAFPYPLRAAREGFIGHVTTNGPPVMTAWGGAAASICNNPLAWAVPTRRPPEIVLDMACSTVAKGKIRVAEQEGRRIPLDWATGPDGAPTDDPSTALQGFLLPAGGAKGYGLAVINELLTGALALGPVLGGVPAAAVTGDAFTTSLDISHVVQVIDPSAFGPGDAFLARVEAVRDELRAAPTRPGVDRVRLPGEPEHDLELVRRQEGIPCSQAALDGFVRVVGELGLPIDVAATLAL